ncbi:serine/threonine protein kinase [Glycomyces terrestris]|uniref:serine/threonine protein kinase n=1 Tax=Glycomyces terrestris TaxID=2493553 RepID=UPI0018D5987F|nr:serine/threonine-protein kinase [Glycomyces terrestris]
MQPLSPTDPDRIGPYRVFAELGRGAMGRVLLGAGPDGRLVAVKTIREWLVEDEEFLARFREEVRKSTQVSGLYTAAVIKARPHDPVPWLASEFLRGPTLDAAVKAGGPLPEESALRLAAGLAAALESIHAAGVIHRDLKPGNVILEANGPRVIDFGIARAAEGSDLTRTGALIGTPGFMSPEQTRSQPLTPASDVFSLGSVLVLACTGAGPFTGSSTLDTMNNVVRAEPDLDGVPVRVRSLVERCLAAEPADRPSPAELLALIGPLPPTSRPWPDPVAALEGEQRLAIARFLDEAEEEPTRVDFGGPTLVTDPNRPTWVQSPPPEPERTPPPPRPGPPSPPQPGPASPPRPPVSTPNPAAGAGSAGGSGDGSGAGIGAAFFVVALIIAALVWYENRGGGDDDEPSDREAYVEDCRDDGYSASDCETSWSNDPSFTWTGELHTEWDEETTPWEEETTDSGPSQSEVYIAECEADGYSQSECETSWYNDPSYTWTGQLYEGQSQYEVYVEECVADGYSEADCDASWYEDPSYTWTGVLH